MDLRHEAIFFYITFAGLWFLILTPMLSAAQADSFIANSTFTGDNIVINSTLNESGLDASQLMASFNVVDFAKNLISFHFSVWYIDVFIVIIGVALLTYSGVSLLPPGA